MAKSCQGQRLISLVVLKVPGQMTTERPFLLRSVSARRNQSHTDAGVRVALGVKPNFPKVRNGLFLVVVNTPAEPRWGRQHSY